jgi:hypothetical protein
MPFLAPRCLSVGQWCALMLATALVPGGLGAPQQTAPAQELGGAIGLAVSAQEELDCTRPGARDPIAGAIALKEKALATARGFTSADPTQRGQAAAFISRQEQELRDLQLRQQKLGDTALKIGKTVKQLQLETAMKMIGDAQAPACDARYQGLAAGVKEKRASAEADVAKGDALLQGDPRAALVQYREARLIDREFPGVLEKATQASKAVEKLVWERKAAGGGPPSLGRKIAVALVSVAVMAGAGYYAAGQAGQRK